MSAVLGDIELERVIGRGGMAVVWRGRSRRESLPVAVKVLTQADDPIQLRRFHDEIRAVARLRHRNIVDVIEMGVVPASLADAGPGLQPGSPWLAMEYVDGGTLRDYAPRLSWREVRHLLTQILSALSHAHARGLIHRDLKPSNILVNRDSGGRLDCHVVDFGIAYTRGLHDRDSALEERVSGTPKYMAPEQIEGRWRDHGPWTDLYAVGCIAYWLASGRPPFTGDSISDLLRGHLYEKPQPLEGEHPLPAGFDRWVANLLRKDSNERYRFAADAAYGLARLPAIEFDGPIWHHADHVENDEDVTEAFTQREWASVEHQRFQRATLQTSPGTAERAPLPRTWRSADRGHVERHPGLSLFALRTPPLIGREETLDQIWEALQQVTEQQAPRCIILQGREGTGKSRIAEWIGERAFEVGAATNLRATHSSSGGPAAGLGAMFARHFECFGLGLSEIEGRLSDAWARHGPMDHQGLHDVRVLSRFMPYDATKSRDSGFHLALDNPYATFERALRIIAADRPAYLWLDDVHWSSETIEFVQELLDASELPVLLVCTVQREALEEQVATATLVDDLATHPRSARQIVTALDDREQSRLIASMLPLDDAVVEEFVRRTGGNPLFAVQLLDECVDRNAFHVEGGQFRLDADAPVVLSDDVRSVWLQRVANVADQLDDTQSDAAWQSLELAAAMGSQVEDAQWRHACNLADLQVDEELFERYLDSRLIERSEGQWSFVHSSLRDVLEQHARAEGRWRRLCQVCAESVRWFGPRQFGELERRRAQYFLQADERATALRPLLRAARKKLQAGRVAESERLLQRHERLCEDLGLEPGSEQRTRNRLVQAEIAFASRELDAAVGLARTALDDARALGEPRLLSDALLVRGDVMQHRDSEEAIRAHDEALELRENLGEDDGYVEALISAAQTRCFHPGVEQAVELAQRAIGKLRDASPEVAHARLVLATARRQRGDFDEALGELSRARQVAEETSSTMLMALCELENSRVLRLAGRPARAERWAQRARNTFRSHGDRLRALADLEHMLAARSRYRDDRVRAELPQIIARTQLPGTDVRAAEGYFILAALSAPTARVREFIDRGRPSIEVGSFDRCLAVAVDLAADASAEAGKLNIANELWSLARMQWRMLGTTTVSPR